MAAPFKEHIVHRGKVFLQHAVLWLLAYILSFSTLKYSCNRISHLIHKTKNAKQLTQ